MPYNEPSKVLSNMIQLQFESIYLLALEKTYICKIISEQDSIYRMLQIRITCIKLYINLDNTFCGICILWF